MPKRNFEQGSIRVLLRVQLPTGIGDVAFVDDVVPLEYGSGLVAADLLRHLLLHADPDQVPYTGAPQIVEKQADVHEFVPLPLLAADGTLALRVNRLLL